ncbi:MAG: AAA family ATPase [Euzebyales bacterium]|nr:AAA family ATPase [Euzebyales bacterium]
MRRGVLRRQRAPPAGAPRPRRDGRGKGRTVGDHHQLPEIDAGGPSRGLLGDNHRQRARWERDAVDQLGNGDVSHALDVYTAPDRIVLPDTAEEARDRLVTD